MKTTRKMLKNIILFIILIVFTFTIILKDADFIGIYEAFTKVRFMFIAIAIISMLAYISCEAINIGRILNALNEKTTFLQNLKYALIGFFFSSITPAASGGQPMQIYYMHKDNITVANSTLALLIHLSCVQITTLSFAIFSLFFNFQYMNAAMAWFFIIGITLNGSALAILIISIFSRRVTKWMINFAIKVLKFFRFKNVEDKRIKFETELASYQDSAKYARKNKKLILKTLLTTYIQFLLFYSISYWVYSSFGLTQHNAFEIITLQALLYGMTSGIPSPGAVGASEGGFLAIYSQIYAGAMVNTAMLITRGVNFYLFVLISFVVVVFNTIRDKKQKRVEQEIEEQI